MGNVVESYVVGMLRLGGEPGWYFCIEIRWRTALCKGEPGCEQLEQEPDGQGALMEAGWATSHS